MLYQELPLTATNKEMTMALKRDFFSLLRKSGDREFIAAVATLLYHEGHSSSIMLHCIWCMAYILKVISLAADAPAIMVILRRGKKGKYIPFQLYFLHLRRILRNSTNFCLCLNGQTCYKAMHTHRVVSKYRLLVGHIALSFNTGSDKEEWANGYGGGNYQSPLHIPSFLS